MHIFLFIWKISDYQFFSKAFTFHMLQYTCLPQIKFSFLFFLHYWFCVSNSKDRTEQELFFLNCLFFDLLQNGLNNNFLWKILSHKRYSGIPLSRRGVDSKNVFLSRTSSPAHSFMTPGDNKNFTSRILFSNINKIPECLFISTNWSRERTW